MLVFSCVNINYIFIAFISKNYLKINWILKNKIKTVEKLTAIRKRELKLLWLNGSPEKLIEFQYILSDLLLYSYSFMYRFFF